MSGLAACLPALEGDGNLRKRRERRAEPLAEAVDAAGTDRLRRNQRPVGTFSRQELSGRRPCRPAEARRRARPDEHLHIGVRTDSDDDVRHCGGGISHPRSRNAGVRRVRRQRARVFLSGRYQDGGRVAWSFCPRHILRRALERLASETGVRLLAAFEQEFTYSGVSAHAWQPYELDMFRQQGLFGEALLAAMRQVGVIPDSFLAEYGARQFEVTSAPALGVRAADDAVVTRQLAQAVAFRLGHRVSFCPIPQPNGTGNGTHIHWSFKDPGDRPVLYDESQPWHLSPMGRHFVAGIQHHLPALCAVTAPSVASSTGCGPIAGHRSGPTSRRSTAARRSGSARSRAATPPRERGSSTPSFVWRMPPPAPISHSRFWFRPASTAFGAAWKSRPRIRLPCPRACDEALSPGREPSRGRVVGYGRARRLSRLQARRARRPSDLDEDEICRRYAEAY